MSRANHRVHPLLLAPAGVDRSVWKKKTGKIRWLMMSDNASLKDVMEHVSMYFDFV
jgi:hypothetical protein